MSLFVELMQVSLGLRKSLSSNPTEKEWLSLFDTAQKQSVVGVAFEALEQLSKQGQKPPLSILYDWIGLNEQIRQNNLIINQRSADVSQILSKYGFRSCILKGQGNSSMYPNPLSRQPGDIDVWVDGDKNSIINCIHNLYPRAKVREHHVDFPIFNDVEVEVHFIPNFSVVGRYGKKLNDFFNDSKEKQFSHKVRLPSGVLITIPTLEFNVIYQMSHMMRHFFSEGLGMRHILDYYYLLKKLYIESGCHNYSSDFQALGMKKFAGGVMWVLKEYLGMDDAWLVNESDEKRGQLIIEEIIKSGNFGQYDDRAAKRVKEKSATLSILIRNIKFLKLFPEESLSAPITGLINRLAIG